MGAVRLLYCVVFGLGGVAALCAAPAWAQDAVVFADPGLEAAVRQEAGIPAGPIPAARVAALTRLDASVRGITDLTGIDACENLELLHLESNAIADLAPLAELPALRILGLEANAISDLTVLVESGGIGPGDTITLFRNPLSEAALCDQIPALFAKGAYPGYSGQCPNDPGEGEGESPEAAHTADQDRDGNISISELMRAIQLYNFERLHCAEGTEDNYAPGPGEAGCYRHDSDYGPHDWTVDISELLRLVQFYTSGGYVLAPPGASEDGFAPKVVEPPTMTLTREVPSCDCYEPGVPLDISLTVHYHGDDDIRAVGVYETLPEGWSFDGFTGTALPGGHLWRPESNTLESYWITIPQFPVTVTYRTTPGPDAAGDQPFTGYVEFRPGMLDAHFSEEAVTVLTKATVPFPDPALEAAVREHLFQSNGGVAFEDLAQLKTLIANDSGIQDLRGLEHATSLEILVLADNAITDLSPLAGLGGLAGLSITHNQVTDLSPLIPHFGVGLSSWLYAHGNPLSADALCTQIPALEARGVEVHSEGECAAE